MCRTANYGHRSVNYVRIAFLAAATFLSGTGAVAQQNPSVTSCFITALPVDIKSEGLAESVAPVKIHCNGYEPDEKETAPSLLRVSLNTPLAPLGRATSGLGLQPPILTFTADDAATATLDPDPSPDLIAANTIQWSIPSVPELLVEGQPCYRCETTGDLHLTLQNIRVAPGKLLVSPWANSAPFTTIIATVSVFDSRGQMLGANTLAVATATRSIHLNDISPVAKVSCSDNSTVVRATLAEGRASFFKADEKHEPAIGETRPPNSQLTLLSIGLSDLPEGFSLHFPPVLRSSSATTSAATARTTATLVRVETIEPQKVIGLYAITASSDAHIDSLVVSIGVVWHDESQPMPELDASVTLEASLESPLRSTNENSRNDKAQLVAPGPHEVASVKLTSSCWTHLLYPVITTQDHFDTLIVITDPSQPDSRLPGPHTCELRLFESPAEPGSSTSRSAEISLPANGQAIVSVLRDLVDTAQVTPEGFRGYAIASCPVAYAVGTAAILAEDVEPAVVSSLYYASRLERGQLSGDKNYRTALFSGLATSNVPAPVVTPQMITGIEGEEPSVGATAPAARLSPAVVIPQMATGLANGPSGLAAPAPTAETYQAVVDGETACEAKALEIVPAHAQTHSSSGTDPITPESIGALARYNSTVQSVDPQRPALTVRAAPSQAVALQEWRNSNGILVANVTARGSGFFSEMGLSAKPGQSAVSIFLETGGVRRFALSAAGQKLRIIRYGPDGSALDIPVEFQETGDVLITSSLHIGPDISPGNGIRVGPGYIDLPLQSAPPAPPRGFARLYADAGTQTLAVIPSPAGLALAPAAAAALTAEAIDFDPTNLPKSPEPNAANDVVTRGGAFLPQSVEGLDGRDIAAAAPIPTTAAPHAETHKLGGTDPVLPPAIGAAESNSAVLFASAPILPALTVAGVPGQTAPLQSWRDGQNTLAAVVTSDGSAFFRELGLAAPQGVLSTKLSMSTPSGQVFKLISENADLTIGHHPPGADPAMALRISSNGDTHLPHGVAVSNNNPFGYTAVEYGYIDIPLFDPAELDPLLDPPEEGLRIYGTNIPDALTQVSSIGNDRTILFGEGIVSPTLFCREVSEGVGIGVNNLATPWLDNGGNIICDSMRMPVRP